MLVLPPVLSLQLPPAFLFGISLFSVLLSPYFHALCSLFFVSFIPCFGYKRSFFSVFFFVGFIILGIFLFKFLVIIFAVIFSVPALNVNSFGGLLFDGGLARFDFDHFFPRHQLILSHTDTVRFSLDKNVRRPPGVAQIYPGPRERTLTVRRVFINFVSGFHEPVLVVFSGIYPNFKFKLPTPVSNKIYTP
jgi:hypothetical protein